MKNEPVIKLDEYWPYQISVLANLIAKHTTSVLKAHGDLNLSQWRVLAAVAEKPGRTAADVVAVTPMDKGIVSRATASLVANGILEKKSDTDDKRRTRLHVTETGIRNYSKISADLVARTNKIGLSNDLKSNLSKAIFNMSEL